MNPPPVPDPGHVKVVLVAVAGAVYSIDKPYEYAVPKALRESIAVGCRVMVPFGAGNRRREGIVLAVRDKSERSKLKSIQDMLDAEPVLNEAGIRLALWMRTRYFCTYFDAVRAILPSGLWHTFSDTVVLTPGLDVEEARAALVQLKGALCAFEALCTAGGRLPYTELETMCRSWPKILKTLTEKGIVTLEKAARRRVGDKTLKTAKLAVPAEEALAVAAEKARSAPSQKAVLSLLCDIGSASVKEICYFTGASPIVLTNLAKKGLVTLEEQEMFRRPAANTTPREPFVLNQEQQEVYERLRGRLDEEVPHCALLHGVTGSGKTSVYMELIRHVLASGGGAIVMVPEIVLTPQFMAVFAGVFGDRVALLHSGLTLGERYDEWKRIRAGLAPVVLGTRSAVFAPLDNLKLIVLDEEQEYTYKSENAPRYHAREVAQYRVAQQKGLLLLGSATPSVESAWSARSGRYDSLSMCIRYNRYALPEVLIADMRPELADGNPTCISRLLRGEIAKNLEAGRQSILFLNRRGYNRLLLCEDCGQAPQCVRCSVAMTYHAANDRLMCHQCGHSERKRDSCPQCGGRLRPVGIGTQRVEEDLENLFPGVGCLRMDTDTTGSRGAHEAILKRFRERNVPILIGTQMVTKGLDFPNVTLVGVLDADMALYMNDFRASERTFGLITQVVGRAGRGETPGRAVIQTFTPGHPVLKAAAAQDYETFYENEIVLRETCGLPPFADVTVLSLSGLREEEVRHACLRVRSRLEEQGALFGRILGPAPASVLKVNNRYRYMITLTGRSDKAARGFLSALLVDFEKDPKNKGVHLYIDVNPY